MVGDGGFCVNDGRRGVGKSSVETWAEGKGPVVAIIAAQIARGGEDVYDWLLHEEKGRGLALPVRVGDVDEWLKLYRQHRRVQRVWNSVLGPIIFGDSEAGEAVNAFFEGLRELQRTPVEELRKELENLTGQDKKELGKLYVALEDAVKSAIAEDPAGGAEIDAVPDDVAREAVGTAEVLFTFMVSARCWYECGEAPVKVLRRARLGELAALETILRVDKSVVRDKRVAEQIHDAALTNRARFERIGNAFRGGLTAKANRRKVNGMLAGLISKVSELCGQRLQEPEIRALFDAVARDRGRGLICKELPESPEAFQKAIQRERRFWSFPALAGGQERPGVLSA